MSSHATVPSVATVDRDIRASCKSSLSYSRLALRNVNNLDVMKTDGSNARLFSIQKMLPCRGMRSNHDTPMPNHQTFEERYPTIHRFVEEIGWIEIGQDNMITSFVRAYDEGGTVYEGKSSYPSMDVALADLERGIQAYLDENGI
jgi:hypothetical protein